MKEINLDVVCNTTVSAIVAYFKSSKFVHTIWSHLHITTRQKPYLKFTWQFQQQSNISIQAIPKTAANSELSSSFFRNIICKLYHLFSCYTTFFLDFKIESTDIIKIQTYIALRLLLKIVVQSFFSKWIDFNANSNIISP